MNFPSLMNATGSLYAATSEEWTFPDLSTIESLRERSSQRRGWLELVLNSPVPLIGEVATDGGEYLYPFLLRRHQNHLIFASTHSALVTKLLGKLGIRKMIRSPRINVGKIVDDLSAKPGRYTLSTVYAGVDGYGDNLRTMALFGDDLAEASLFRSMLPQLRAYRAVLREAAFGGDVLNVSSQGEVAFSYRGIRSLQAVDEALGFLSQAGYIRWPGGGMVAAEEG